MPSENHKVYHLITEQRVFKRLEGEKQESASISHYSLLIAIIAQLSSSICSWGTGGEADCGLPNPLRGPAHSWLLGQSPLLITSSRGKMGAGGLEGFRVSFLLSCVSLCALCVCVCACSVVSDSLGPHGLDPASLLCPWDSPGKNPGVGCHFLLQEIFLTQGSNPGLLNLLHFGWILYLLSPFREAPVSYYLVLLSPSILCTKLP